MQVDMPADVPVRSCGKVAEQRASLQKTRATSDAAYSATEDSGCCRITLVCNHGAVKGFTGLAGKKGGPGGGQRCQDP